MLSKTMPTPFAEHLNTLIEAFPDGIFFKDGAGRWRVANAAALKILGMSGHAWEGKTDLELASELPHLAETLNTCLRSDERTWEIAARCNFLEPAPDNDGVISIAKIPLFNPDGSRRGLAAIAHDFTESMKAEPTLAAANQMLLTVLDGMDCIVFAVDMSTHEIIFVNQYAKRSLNEQIKIGGLCWEELKCGQGAPCRFCNELSLPDENANSSLNLDWEYRNPANQRWYHVRGSALRWIDGRLARLEIATDITERKAQERSRRKRQEDICHASRLSVAGQMASGLAHEISQPLAAANTYLQGCMSLIESGQHDIAQLGEAIKSAQIQTERAGKIIAHLRGLMRKDGNSLEPVDLNKAIGDSIHFLNHEIQSHHIDVSFDFSDLPLVRANPIELEQVFINLLKNAIEAMHDAPNRKLEISTRRLDGTLEVAIGDKGKGISEREIDRIFIPFASSKADGLGLGLTISQGIIESHGGKIRVSSSPDTGSVFSITLPLKDHA